MIRNLHLWLPSYLRDLACGRTFRHSGKTVDVMICVADHFEPLWGNPTDALAEERMETWKRRLPVLAHGRSDADGRAPVHTFFFPAEQYRKLWLDALAELTRGGMAEVEVHLHHGQDTVESLRKKLSEFVTQLAGHGLLSTEGSSSPKYAFIHGDWALANSGPGPDTCGVSDELPVLLETGCYADLTLPSAPSPTQISTINRIYFADPRGRMPRPHAKGAEARVGGYRPEELLMLQGPLGLDWGRRKWGVLPRIENGDLSGGNPPHPRRVPLWMRGFVHVAGRPEWVFLKLYTHGAAERNQEALLGAPMASLLTHLESEWNDGKRFRLHYVSAREMVNIARAAMDGKDGNAGAFRDYVLKPRWSRA